MKCPKCESASVMTTTTTEREAMTVHGELISALYRTSEQHMCADCGHEWEE
jgi:hypothetical protein